MKNDSDIQRDVEAELRWIPEVDETDIAVKATNGAVALTGFVRTYFEKYQAEQAAKRVKGVAAVANDIEVRLSSGDNLSDPEIARNATSAIRTALPWAHDEVKALVHGGTVTLEGKLDWDFQREDVARAVRLQRGVKSVINLIGLRPRIIPGDIKQKIKSALLRDAQIDADHISVEAHDGTVVLKGQVRSWPEREEAQRTAWAAPGVLQVSNQIEVRAL